MREITGRYRDYFSHFTVEIPDIRRVSSEYQSVLALQRFSAAERELALVRGAQVLEDLGAVIDLDSTAADAVSTTLMQSILDAYAANYGAIELQPSPVQKLAEPNPTRFAVHETDSGVRYARSMGAGRPLIIISTTGAPLRLWSTLIDDSDVDRPCILVQSNAGPLIEGGTPNRSSLMHDVADIREVLAAEDANRADVVAWCNGSRTAIALAREAADRVSAVLLISPTFHGVMDATKYPSPFEDSLVDAFQIAKADREAASHLINSLASVGPPDVDNLSIDRRVEAVLRSPPADYARDLVIPLSTTEYFENYIDRVLDDERYDVSTALQEVRCPIWFTTGTHDAAINTQLTRDVLSKYGRDVVQITVQGAGHHIHLLQYGYFRYLLRHLASASLPPSTARVSVELLTRTD